MSLLKRENILVSIFMMFFMSYIFIPIMASNLKLIDKKAWYSKEWYWIIGTLCMIFPVFILYLVFLVEMLCKIAKKFNIPGDEIYNTPYTYIICIIVPVIGWILLIVILIYLMVYILKALYNKEGEKYLN